MIVKHNSASPDSAVKVADFFNDGVTIIVGNWINIDGNDYRLSDGDYFIKDDNGVPVRYVSAAQYASDLVLQNIVREEVGRDLIRSIWAQLRASALPDSQKAGIATAISPVMGLIRDGEITSARFLANATTTTASYTAGVKSALLSTIDQAIAKL
jgi:hypothetical protein